MEFPRHQSWNKLPFSPPRALPNPGFEPMSPALAGRLLTTEQWGKRHYWTRPLLTVSKGLQTIYLTGLLWSWKLLPLIASSHIYSYSITIVDLIELYYWSIIPCCKVVIIFYQRVSQTFVILEAIISSNRQNTSNIAGYINKVISKYRCGHYVPRS